jgi:ABC-type glycerol-3-phosphate transport system substrate-binding protein
MPLRVNVPIFAAKKDGLSTIENMDSILSYIENSKLPYSSTATYKGLLENYLALYSSDLYQDGKLDESKMKAFLENLKKIADNIKATKYAEGEDKSSNSTDDLYDYTRLFRNELIGFAYGKYSTAMDQVNDYLSLAIMISATKENHSSFASMNQMFIPKGLIGLNSKSKETATAKKFIQFLFSNDVQKTNLYEGFPINTESLKVWTAEEREEESYGFGNDDGTISATWPTKDQREAFEKILLSVNKPINLNQVINNMIINESLPYFTGDIDAGQAANAAISKINTYLAE